MTTFRLAGTLLLRRALLFEDQGRFRQFSWPEGISSSPMSLLFLTFENVSLESSRHGRHSCRCAKTGRAQPRVISPSAKQCGALDRRWH